VSFPALFHDIVRAAPLSIFSGMVCSDKLLASNLKLEGGDRKSMITENPLSPHSVGSFLPCLLGFLITVCLSSNLEQTLRHASRPEARVELG